MATMRVRDPFAVVAAVVGRTRRDVPVQYVQPGTGPNAASLFRSAPGATGQLGRTASSGVLYSIIDLLSTSTAADCWHLYRKSASGRDEDRVEVTSHLALDLWRKPNDHMTQSLFVATFQQHKDLVGEFWWVLTHNAFGWPDGMYVVRPDRIQPVPHPTEGVAGYVYTGPSGEQVPLDLHQVIRNRAPNPLDPGPAGRGLGVVQAILTDLDAGRYSAEWNRNFFLNSAEPGGVIQFDRSLSDPEFDSFRTRWAEQHKGVANAHRVAILEQGQWVDRKYTNRDMQFVELQKAGDDRIRMAYRIHPHMLGQSEDVNLANAQAADYTFAKWLSVPRLDVIKSVLNNHLLPQFGADNVEFDYDTPVPEDRESDNAERESKANTYKTLIDAGVDPADAAAAAGLPPMRHVVRGPAQLQPVGEPA